ncbi:MAG: 2,3-bisphosphoglycerate-independent phosphoglycerate mutase [Candidatus Bathyarchaeota archaeon]|nr:2,3-bisphosphoglycerate-independent phosphoglycerate mutase [Candidatus Bathyarchaeota archaeon]
MAQRKIILIVRDGWGYTEETTGNAAYIADTPNNDRYMAEYPWTTLKCTGNAVGLPEGTQGGSEPGHLTMGAGRVVWQPLEEINQAINNGSFYEKKPFKELFGYLKETGGKLHLAGLFSDQGIHGTTHHLHALLDLAKRNGFEDVFVHCFLDGRDVPERSAVDFLYETQHAMNAKGVGKYASLVGRYYAMDRDTNWDRTKVAYDLLTQGLGIEENNPFEAIEHQYMSDPDLSDYYIKPIVLVSPDGSPVATVDEGDAFIFWNFRSDRARQLTYALTQSDFKGFKREKNPSPFFVCMSVYDQELVLPAVFKQHSVEKNLATILSENNLKQLRIAETEKYAHVTFFFNSQIETLYHREDRILVPSPKVASYEDQPEMSAYEITEKLVHEIERDYYDFILVNYANCDLVGHSANIEAGVKAAAVVDECVGRVVETGLMKGYVSLVTGDHGNIETLFYPDGSPNPSHGLNPVPFILVSDEPVLIDIKLRTGMGLSSVAPTILWLMGLEKPTEMTGQSLIG